MRELNARLRVEGLTDEESSALPTRLDERTLDGMEISTWRTDSGHFDVLTDIPARDGHRMRYHELIGERPSRMSTASPSMSPLSRT